MMLITNGKNEKVTVRPMGDAFAARQYRRVDGAWTLVDSTAKPTLNDAAAWGNAKYAVKPRIGVLSDNWVRGAVNL